MGMGTTGSRQWQADMPSPCMPQPMHGSAPTLWCALMMLHRGARSGRYMCGGEARPGRLTGARSSSFLPCPAVPCRTQVLQAAICPERRVGDDTLSAVASITHTYVSNDLQVVGWLGWLALSVGR